MTHTTEMGKLEVVFGFGLVIKCWKYEVCHWISYWMYGFHDSPTGHKEIVHFMVVFIPAFLVYVCLGPNLLEYSWIPPPQKKQKRCKKSTARE